MRRTLITRLLTRVNPVRLWIVACVLATPGPIPTKPEVHSDPDLAETGTDAGDRRFRGRGVERWLTRSDTDCC